MTAIIHRCSPFLTFLLGFVIWQGEARAATETQVYQWQAEETTKGGVTVGCEVMVVGMIEVSLYVTANLSLFAEPADPSRVHARTVLKITVTEIALDQGFKKTPVRLYGGWLRTSSGTTVGKLKTIPMSPEVYYLGAAPGMDLFIELVSGMLNGITVGFQRRPDGLDTTMTIPTPPPVETILKLETCIQNLQKRIEIFGDRGPRERPQANDAVQGGPSTSPDQVDTST